MDPLLNFLSVLCSTWSVDIDGAPIETATAHVAFGMRGRDAVVLKIPKPDGDEANASSTLRHFGGHGAVRLLECDACGAMLLERAIPGRPLSELVVAGADDEATAILCDVMAALHRPEAPSTDFPHIEDWGAELLRYRASGDETIAPAIVERAIEIFADLASTQGTLRLLHGDLHHANVLYDRQRGWLAIDPKGVVGEPIYEIGAALRNPTSDTAMFAVPAIIERRIGMISARLGFDPVRALAWTFAQGVLSAAWRIEDGRDPTRGLATAHAALHLL
jgi:streptomycin 6-kinase